MSNTLNVGELLNLVGLSTGVVLYAMLLEVELPADLKARLEKDLKTLTTDAKALVPEVGAARLDVVWKFEITLCFILILRRLNIGLGVASSTRELEVVTRR